MKKYVNPVTEIIVLHTESIMDLGLSDNVGGPEEFGNRNTFEEDVSAEFDNSKSLWDD